jgi:hypothetical protein
MSTAISPDRILATAMGFWSSKTLLSAVELGVFTELARGPADLASLQRALGVHERGARDFFDALVALGFLEREAGRYRNTRETDLFLDRAKPTYVGGMLEMASQRLFGAWNHLTEGLRTGRPHIAAGDVFGALYADPARLETFLRAMTGMSRRANREIAARFPWNSYRTFLDVGTAQGDLPVQIALAHPHLRGGGFDLPVVGPIFHAYASQQGAAERVTFHAGDFFRDELPRADVVLMGHILHDWDLPTKQMLIRKVYDALPRDGAFIVHEALIDDDRAANAFGLLMSLNMLVETPGGFDYTGADCSGWMKAAGFRETRVEHLVGPDSMVVGIK